MPDFATVAVRTRLLRVEVRQHRAQWRARLVDPPAAFAAVPAAVGGDRDAALAALQVAVRALDTGTPAPARAPGSSDLCP